MIVQVLHKSSSNNEAWDQDEGDRQEMHHIFSFRDFCFHRPSWLGKFTSGHIIVCIHTVRSGLLYWVSISVTKWPLSVSYAIQKAASLKSGVSVASIVGHAIQENPIWGLGHVLLEVLGIGQNFCTLLEALGVGQVSSSQPTGIPYTAQWKNQC